MFPISRFVLIRDLKQSENKEAEIINDNNKAKSHVKKCEQGRVTSCQQNVRLAKMHLPLILYSSLKVRQLKGQLLRLHLQRLASPALYVLRSAVARAES